MRSISSLVSGLIFGIGLIVSGMTDPAKVLNFLDFTGTWDPSLAFVLGGAVAVTLLGYQIVHRGSRPMFAEQFYLPQSREIDRPLIAGAVIFGIGWGLGGFCPGPAVTSLSLHAPGTLVFLPSMLIGMWLAQRVKNRPVRSTILSNP